MKVFWYKFLSYLILVSILIWPLDSQGSFLWQQVGGMGLGDPDNTIIVNMETWNNAIYAGIENDVDGARIYRSIDGNTWTKVNNDGFGHAALNSVVDFQNFNGQLYVSTADDSPVPAQTAEIWRSADGLAWNQSGNDGLGNANNFLFYELAVFNNQLYVGSFDDVNGADLFRTADGTNWNNVVNNGFGDANNTAIFGLYSFGGWLWAGTANDNGPQVWRSANGADWDLYLDYNGNPILQNATAINHFFEFNNQLFWFAVNAIDGAHIAKRNTDIFHEFYLDGWGDVNNVWFSQNTVVSGSLLYYGTRNNVTGGELWYTSGFQDFQNFTQIGLDGFGNLDNFAIYALTFKDYLYIGLSTGNGLKGCEIWRRLVTNEFNIINKTLPSGKQGEPYLTQLETAGGTKPYSYRLVKGDLPQGVELSPGGELKGTPQQSGDFQFVVEVQDSFKKVSKAQRVFTLKIVAGVSTGTGGITILPKTGADLY